METALGWKAGALMLNCACSAAFRAAARLRRERREHETCGTAFVMSGDGGGVSFSILIELLGLSTQAGMLPASLVALPMSLPLPHPVVFVPRLLPLHRLLSLLALLLLHLKFDNVALIVGCFGAN